MSITVCVADPVLARMLYLEAKHHGFEGTTPSVHFADPSGGALPTPTEDLLTVAVGGLPTDTAHPAFARLSLPFRAEELKQIVLCWRGQGARIERVGELLYLNGRQIALSRTELELLTLLYENKHRVVTVSEMCAVLGESALHTNTLSVYLYRLRRKLGAHGSCIQTVRKTGCQWIEKGETV